MAILPYNRTYTLTLKVWDNEYTKQVSPNETYTWEEWQELTVIERRFWLEDYLEEWTQETVETSWKVDPKE